MSQGGLDEGVQIQCPHKVGVQLMTVSPACPRHAPLDQETLSFLIICFQLSLPPTPDSFLQPISLGTAAMSVLKV